MITELEIVLFENKFKKNQMQKIHFNTLKLVATDLPLITSIGCSIYKAVTFFTTNYANEHHLLLLEGEDHKGRIVYAFTELCSAESGSGNEFGDTGYFLFLSNKVDEFYTYRKFKNPTVKMSYKINLYGDQLFTLVSNEDKQYKLFGNNCQDYTTRMTKSILTISKENTEDECESDNDSDDSIIIKKPSMGRTKSKSSPFVSGKAGMKNTFTAGFSQNNNSTNTFNNLRSGPLDATKNSDKKPFQFNVRPNGPIILPSLPNVRPSTQDKENKNKSNSVFSITPAKPVFKENEQLSTFYKSARPNTHSSNRMNATAGSFRLVIPKSNNALFRLNKLDTIKENQGEMSNRQN